MKIAIDAREISYSGISRVAINIIESLLNSDKFNSYVLIVKKENKEFFKKYKSKASMVEFNAKTFSVEDFLSINSVLEKKILIWLYCRILFHHVLLVFQLFDLFTTYILSFFLNLLIKKLTWN